MNTQKKFIIFIIFLFLIGGGAYLLFINYFRVPTIDLKIIPSPVVTSVVFNPLSATYSIDDVPVTLSNGQSKDETSSTSIFGQPTIGDLNGDGSADAALILTQNTGGSGTFYYVVAAINTASSTQGTNAVLLGDRIAPQNIEIKSNQIIVNYADRKLTEPMTTAPSVGVSVYLTLDGTSLKKIFAPTKTITYLASKIDSTKYCNGVDMDSASYEKTITDERTTSTPELNTTILQLIKATINAATTNMCREALNRVNITESKGVVSISPIDAWAGVSITMCSCKPLVEVNLLRLPGITKILW